MAKDDQSMEISDDQRHTHSRDALTKFIFLDGVSESTLKNCSAGPIAAFFKNAAIGPP